VRRVKHEITLPIGRTAKLAFELDEARAGCCQAARRLLTKPVVNEAELDECARLDEALAKAHRLLKGTVKGIMLSRLKRRSRAR